MIFNNVRHLCREKGISITKLEDDLGFARSSVCKWNKNEPGIRKVQKVAEYLGVPIEELLRETEDGRGERGKKRKNHILIGERGL